MTFADTFYLEKDKELNIESISHHDNFYKSIKWLGNSKYRTKNRLNNIVIKNEEYIYNDRTTITRDPTGMSAAFMRDTFMRECMGLIQYSESHVKVTDFLKSKANIQTKEIYPCDVEYIRRERKYYDNLNKKEKLRIVVYLKTRKNKFTDFLSPFELYKKSMISISSRS